MIWVFPFTRTIRPFASAIRTAAGNTSAALTSCSRLDCIKLDLTDSLRAAHTQPLRADFHKCGHRCLLVKLPAIKRISLFVFSKPERTAANKCGLRCKENPWQRIADHREQL